MLRILTTHPIQYQVPLWRALADSGEVPFEVWYLSDQGSRVSYDAEFGRSFAWDLDMLEGYPHRFVQTDPAVRVDRFAATRLPRGFCSLLDYARVDALWIQGWQVLAYWQAVAMANARGIPVWLRGESNDLAPVSRLKGIAKRILLGGLFRRVSEFLYIGSANRRLYEHYGVTADHLHPAPYCVDNARFAFQASQARTKRADFRQAWGIPREAFCVLFAGKLIQKKRPRDLVDAARIIGRVINGRPLHLLFAGTGELGEALRRGCAVEFDADRLPVKRADLDDQRPRSSFVGFLNQSEISRAYVAADCLALPSDYGETWGLVVNEAMASGLPCIVSDACGCGSDLVAPLQSGLVFPLGDLRALALALEAVAANPVEPERLWELVERFNLRVAVDSVIDLCRRTTARGDCRRTGRMTNGRHEELGQ